MDSKVVDVFERVVRRVGDHVDKVVGQVDHELELVVIGHLVVLIESVHDRVHALGTLPGDPKIGG